AQAGERKQVMIRWGLALGMIGLAAAPVGAAAQQKDTTATIDRIVAIVGTKAILATQVQEQAFVQLRDQQLPTDLKIREAFLKSLIQQMVDVELVILNVAGKTAIRVTDEEVTQSVDELFRNA